MCERASFRKFLHSLVEYKEINHTGIRRAITSGETIAIVFVNVYLFVAVLQVQTYRSWGYPARFSGPWPQNSTQCRVRNARRSVRFVACCQTSLTCWHSFWQWGQCRGSKLIRLHRCNKRRRPPWFFEFQCLLTSRSFLLRELKSNGF